MQRAIPLPALPPAVAGTHPPDHLLRKLPAALLGKQLLSWPARGEFLRGPSAGVGPCCRAAAIGRAMEWPATTATAASGGYRELLLGPRPARRKRQRADAGCRNPYSCPRRKLPEHRPLQYVKVEQDAAFMPYARSCAGTRGCAPRGGGQRTRPRGPARPPRRFP